MRHPKETVVLQRPVAVECVPSGAPLDLPAGTIADVTQALGTNFTLVVGGQMVRLRGADADAIGRPPPDEIEAPDGPVSHDEAQAFVWRTLKTCYDPEIPVDIVELGLIYACMIEPAEHDRLKVSIRMTLTAPGCGMGEALADEVADKVLALPFVGEVNVDMVFDPPWDRSRMSETAMLALGL
ncbi:MULTISPECIES: putative Fe-S cluster assembly protein SufT [Burkholderia]|uniref:putative Fe-S cluster assembly protein SufT n=1 Tax=Burkholderia TaxID=32008 RepID=UPI00075E6E13|nr:MULTISPECIES: putative Fe-S cluster assembly protein SufT [Burkholderia]AOJ68254.1 FeS assembly SUF system protein SufT [Burkholderia savannae]KVG43175.1 FeS assembly SUF system protein SufT [Burkholderia sp. MSMB0265]KVG80017.1 FeS assembly SUF system protein SufT [Burkholderia sp. MSMB2040]KVG91942.1 FeS assembly SUF system protein SufT [Burkholderia sp. MSMB2042]KVG97303.1 FeS assembly SUF system protein SufT [Burkholderia sp. MSMB2041]